MNYRFEKTKDTVWSSYERQRVRYETIKGLLGKDAVGAELGVYKGGFAEFLLPHCRLIYLVDPWYRHSPFWGTEKSPDTSTVRACLNVMQVYKEDMEAGRVQVVIDFSTRFLKTLPDASLDWVYIDSSHTYKNTKQEIELSLHKVKKNGYLIGDDLSKPGVRQAVSELCDGRGWKLDLDKTNQWAVRNR